MDFLRLSSRLVRTRVFKRLVVIGAVLAIVWASVFGYYYRRYSQMIDQRLSGHVFENTAKIYDRSGNLITTLSGEGRFKRRLVEFNDIPKVLIDAVTAGEDQRFFAHYGLDFKRIAGAFIWNVRENRRLQGGS